MEPEGFHPQALLPPLPPAPETCQWWLITPSPMEFENIGFSRPVPSPNAPGLTKHLHKVYLSTVTRFQVQNLNCWLVQNVILAH